MTTGEVIVFVAFFILIGILYYALLIVYLRLDKVEKFIAQFNEPMPDSEKTGHTYK